MRVLLFSHHCQLGGAETFMLSLRAGLIALGHHCELFFVRRGPMESLLPREVLVHFGSLADAALLVKRHQFDILHARSSDWETGVSALRRRVGKLIVTSHGYVGSGWNTTNCDAYVTCAQWLAVPQQQWTDLRVQAIPNGIDTMRFTPMEVDSGSRPIVAWVGRGADPRKRLDAFAAIAVRLHDLGFRVWLIEPHGPQEVSQVFPDAVGKLSPVVEFWDRVPVEEMPERYRAIAASGGCVVSTSQWEGLPLTLLEAQACGAPVVATDVPGTNECVRPEHGGLLFPMTAPPHEIADEIAATIADHAEMQRRRVACAAFVHSRFTLTGMTDAYARVYSDAPYPPHGSYWQQLKARRLLSPIWHWEDYIEHGRCVGLQQYEAAQRLLGDGHHALASDLARAAVASSPTIYLRPQRLRLLVTAHSRIH